uniref:Uncharacterized protein n=1 Tax=Glossina palpalis gambiensis TaxID=67801 RepID=A0A1B0BKD5_9MUSC
MAPRRQGQPRVVKTFHKYRVLAVKNLCETDKPREEFNRIIGEVVNLGTVVHRNTLEYKGVIDLTTDSNDEEEDMAGLCDCYGRNARGRRRNARGGHRGRSRAQSRKRKRSSSRGPRSPKKMT